MLLQVLLALTAVIVTGQILGRALSRFGQPAVIGEVLAGIVLGPSLLGPELSARILPPAIAPTLGVIAQLGVVLYMFSVGLEIDIAAMRASGRAIFAISWSSIVLPFAIGVALAPMLYAPLGVPGVPWLGFALFMGIAMSVTAFPVLARILQDRGIEGTRIGRIALSAAAIDDVTAWCLLAAVVGVTRAEMGEAVRVVAGAALFIAVMVLAVRPIVRRVVSGASGDGPDRSAALMFAGLLASAMATEAIGIHAIFGAFLFGAIIPHDAPAALRLGAQLRGTVAVLLLPAFFAFTGMRTRIDLLDSAAAWALCGLIIAAAVFGKFAGAVAGARLARLPWREASIVGILMNTRGLMELIVLNIGLELGILSPSLFAMMVLMALATTMMTGPLLQVVRLPAGEPAR